MNRRIVSLTLGLLLSGFVLAGEQPGPGLEVFDSGIGIDSQPSPGAVYPAAPIQSLPPQTGYVPPSAGGTTYDSSPFLSEPYTDPAYQGQTFGAPAYQGQTYVDPGFAGQAPEAAAPAPEPVEPPPGYARYPADPVSAAMADLNTKNPNFPGMDGAVAQGNLRAAADIVWRALRERRIVDTTMARGPGGSAGRASPYEVQAAFTAINFRPDPGQQESPMLPAGRINTILNAFAEPVVDDPTFGGAMELALVRLHSDIYAVRNALPETADESVYQELARTYLRAATTCDFFLFPNRDLAREVDSFLVRSSPLFYPDGASIAGDVGGVTGNLLQDLLMLDFYTRDDNWFRRELSNFWKILEQPARYAAALALPDSSLPRFGPRGSRELTPGEVERLKAMYPKSALRVNRIGLAASHSFPESSNQKSYGGIFASRSGPEPTARYMAIRFGPMGIMRGVPAHQDFGSVVLMSRGIRFLVDSGGYGGEAAMPAAHSVLSLDGEYVLPASYNEPGQPVDAVWRTNASLDYATDKASFADGKSWQRTMLYVKDLPGENRADYWLVLDHVDMKNDNRPHQARIRYQLAPGIQAYNDGSGILASANFGQGSALRFFAIDAGAELTVSEGSLGLDQSQVYDVSGGVFAAPSVALTRTLVGDSTTTTLLYPGENNDHKPARIERDADLIRGRTGAVVVDHGRGRIDVIAWAPPGTELVTPTLNLVMSADLGVFRIRNGKIVRMNFVNLERFQAKEPNGGQWSLRVTGPAQTLTFEPEANGGWQVLSDPANPGGATLQDINLGPAITGRRFSIRPGDMRVIAR